MELPEFKEVLNFSSRLSGLHLACLDDRFRPGKQKFPKHAHYYFLIILRNKIMLVKI